MIKISEVLTEFSIPTGKSIDESKAEKEKIFNMLVKRGDTPVDARYEVDKSYDFVKKRFPRASVSKKAEIISALSKYESVKKEGTCGYGLDGKLGEEPAGPHLLKKKNESVGSKKYNGRDWFWPHDYRHYLRDASPAQRKKIHDAWLKIGVPVKGTGLKISDRYLEPKKNQLKKAWTIVRKVVAPKELGMPIPEGIDTSRLKESSKEYGKSLDKIANDKKLKAISNKDKELLKKLAKLLQKESVFDLDEACQKGYMTHPTRKTKIMFGKRYRNCVKKEGVDTTMTMEQAGMIADNICVNCGDFANENLRKWFSDRWVNIGKKKKGGGHPPCGSSGKKRGYAKCVPASKAASMSKKQKASATRRKRAAQNKAGRGGTSSLSGGGKKPIRVSTKPKK